MTVAAPPARQVDRSTGRPVELLRWPEDADRRELLRREGRLRLLLLGPDAMPPGRSEQEDWIRLPADERDVSARLLRLVQQAPPTRSLQPGDVVIEEGGLVRRGTRYVALSPSETEIVRRLAERPGRLVPRSELVELLWGDAPRRAHSLDSRMFTVRRRLGELGLTVHTKRGYGFILTAAGTGSAEGSG